MSSGVYLRQASGEPLRATGEDTGFVAGARVNAQPALVGDRNRETLLLSVSASVGS